MIACMATSNISTPRVLRQPIRKFRSNIRSAGSHVDLPSYRILNALPSSSLENLIFLDGILVCGAGQIVDF